MVDNPISVDKQILIQQFTALLAYYLQQRNRYAINRHTDDLFNLDDNQGFLRMMWMLFPDIAAAKNYPKPLARKKLPKPIAIAIDPGTKNTGIAYVISLTVDGKKELFIEAMPCLQSKKADSIIMDICDHIEILCMENKLSQSLKILLGDSRDRNFLNSFLSNLRKKVKGEFALLEGSYRLYSNDFECLLIDESKSSEIALTHILQPWAENREVIACAKKMKQNAPNLLGIAYQQGLDDSLAAAVIAARWAFSQAPHQKIIEISFALEPTLGALFTFRGKRDIFFNGTNYSNIIRNTLNL